MEFVISVGLSELQAQIYETYLENRTRGLLEDYNNMRLIWTHPLVMKLNDDRRQGVKKEVRLASSLIQLISLERQIL